MLLKENNVTGVVVNSVIGEGLTMTVVERMRVVEEWLRVCRKQKFLCLVQIGGAAVADVYELAMHAEKIGVDGVFLLCDLFYRPRCEEDLVHYMRDVAQYCPTRPMLYTHIPIMTRVNSKI